MRSNRSNVALLVGLLSALVSPEVLAQPEDVADAGTAAGRSGVKSIGLELGAVYLDSSFRYQRGDVRVLGAGPSVGLSAQRFIVPGLALGLTVRGALGIRPYVLIDGYAASVQDQNTYWLGTAGPFVEYQQPGSGLCLLADLGVATSRMRVPDLDLGTAVGLGLGVAAGWDFAPNSELGVTLLGRATGTQTWESGTRISGLATGIFLEFEPRAG